MKILMIQILTEIKTMVGKLKKSKKKKIKTRKIMIPY